MPPALGCCAFLGEALLPPGLFSKFALRVSSLVFPSTRVTVWASAATASHRLPGCDQSGSGPTPSSGAGLQPQGRSGVTPSGSTGPLAHAPPCAQPQSGCGRHWSAVGAGPVRKAAELEGGAGFRPYPGQRQLLLQWLVRVRSLYAYPRLRVPREGAVVLAATVLRPQRTR